MDRVREGEGVGLSLPPAGGDSFLEPNGSQINEILISIFIYIVIYIYICIPRSLQGRIASRFVSFRFKVRSHRIAPRSGRKHGDDDGDDDDGDDDDDDGDDGDGDDGDDDDGDDVALPPPFFFCYPSDRVRGYHIGEGRRIRGDILCTCFITTGTIKHSPLFPPPLTKTLQRGVPNAIQRWRADEC